MIQNIKNSKLAKKKNKAFAKFLLNSNLIEARTTLYSKRSKMRPYARVLESTSSSI